MSIENYLKILFLRVFAFSGLVIALWDRFIINTILSKKYCQLSFLRIYNTCQFNITEIVFIFRVFAFTGPVIALWDCCTINTILSTKYWNKFFYAHIIQVNLKYPENLILRVIAYL